MTDDPVLAYYKQRSQRARGMADAARDPAIKRVHHEMADRYEELAVDPAPRRVLGIVGSR